MISSIRGGNKNIRDIQVSSIKEISTYNGEKIVSSISGAGKTFSNTVYKNKLKMD